MRSPHKHITDAEWASFDDKTRENLNARARPGEEKTVILVDETQITVRAGFCPCKTCGHKFMWECEESDCRCGPCHWTCS